MILLTLDIATKTGWAFGASSHDLSFGSVTFDQKTLGARGAAFVAWLSGMICEHHPGDVVFEAPVLPRKTALATVRILSGLAFACETICFKKNIRCSEAHQQTVRLFVAGRGNASKDDVAAAVSRLGYRPRNHDESDAIALWLYSAHALGMDERLSISQ